MADTASMKALLEEAYSGVWARVKALPRLAIGEFLALPSGPDVGVYFIWSMPGELYYVGQSYQLRSRIASHFYTSGSLVTYVARDRGLPPADKLFHLCSGCGARLACDRGEHEEGGVDQRLKDLALELRCSCLVSVLTDENGAIYRDFERYALLALNPRYGRVREELLPT